MSIKNMKYLYYILFMLILIVGASAQVSISDSKTFEKETIDYKTTIYYTEDSKTDKITTERIIVEFNDKELHNIKEFAQYSNIAKGELIKPIPIELPKEELEK